MGTFVSEIQFAFQAVKLKPRYSLFQTKLRLNQTNFAIRTQSSKFHSIPTTTFKSNNSFLIFPKRYSTTNNELQITTNESAQEISTEIKELEEFAKDVKTSIPWKVSPTSTAKKPIRLKDIKIPKRFVFQKSYSEPANLIYWHPPLQNDTFDKRLILRIRDGKLDLARSLMKNAYKAGKPYEEWMYSLLIYQYSQRSNALFECKALFNEAVKNKYFPITQQLYHSLLNAYCMHRDIEGAQFLLEHMRANRVVITQETYELFLVFKNPVYQYVEELVKVMRNTDSLEPSGLIWSHLIDSYRRDYNYEKAIATFHAVPMEQRDINCIHAIMNVYFDQLEVAKAEYYFRKALNANGRFKATSKTWHVYLAFYEKHGDYKATDALVDRMIDCGYLMTAEVYNSIIRSRFNGDNYHYALQAYESMLQTKKKPTKDTYATVFDCLVATDQIERAEDLYKIAKKTVGFEYNCKTHVLTAYQPKVKFSRKPAPIG